MPELNLHDYMGDFKNCIQYEKPYCQAQCPFHIDINGYIDKLKQGNYNSAFKVYRNAVGFPQIVAKLCSQPCQQVCPMSDYGGSIEMSKLEQATIEHAARTEPTSYNIPVRPGKVAIIGSGLAGLGALLRMATKKYETHIFEKSDRIGGSLNNHPDIDLFLDDIDKQLHHEKYELHLNTEIKTRKELNEQGFDVVFVATGKDGLDFGITDSKNEVGHTHVLLDDGTAWFAGGALIGEEDIYSLSGGLYMGLVLEAYIKTGTPNYPEDEITTNTLIDPRQINNIPATIPKDSTYSKEETVEEASRCLQCQCKFCKTYEDLTAYYDKFPLRIKDEVFATTLEGTSEVKATPAKRLIHTSNLTGINKAVCPKNIDLDNLILAGRQRMHNQEKAPWAFHDFWLKDMDFANGEEASIVRPGKNLSTNSGRKSSDTAYAFFPGCQLGASIPKVVDKTYEYLLKNNEDMGLMLRCCGAPALWSGDNNRHEDSLSTLKSQWEELGSPTLITACPTCTSQIKEYLPMIKVISLYEYLDESSVDFPELTLAGSEYENISIFDPCSTREDKHVKVSMRNLADKLGLKNNALSNQSYMPRCCSFGGHPHIANPKYTDYVVNSRINEGELPYITYCINCRDAFVKAGKKTKHILELLFESDEPSLPTVSERRDNRIFLKKQLLNNYWGEKMEISNPAYKFELEFSESILKEMDSERILKEEVYEVVDYMLSTDRMSIDTDTGIKSGYKKIGYMTFWVSIKDLGNNKYEITDVYSHRMEIELEAVWNGVKQENNM